MSKYDDDFYVRCLFGSKRGKSRNYLEFEFQPTGILRYTNISNYKKEKRITKEVQVSFLVMQEVKRIVSESQIVDFNDELWESPKTSKQEIEVVLGDKHISFSTQEIGSLIEVQSSKDPVGLRVLYYLGQDLKCLVVALISMHFKVNPLGGNTPS